MNIYMLMEGETEPKLYPTWLSFIAPNMKQITNISNINQDNFYVISGKGYPRLLTNTLKAAITDICQSTKFDELWVMLDTDDCTVEDREQEVLDKVASILADNPILKLGSCQVHVIAQKVCIETWGLANERIFPHRNITSELKPFYDHYDVSGHDPELMLQPTSFESSIGEYHYRYLKTMLRARSEKLNYSKTSPSPLNMKAYFDEIVIKVNKDGHVNSFKKFYDLASRLVK